jgi:hypothetical protein
VTRAGLDHIGVVAVGPAGFDPEIGIAAILNITEIAGAHAIMPIGRAAGIPITIDHPEQVIA